MDQSGHSLLQIINSHGLAAGHCSLTLWANGSHSIQPLYAGNWSLRTAAYSSTTCSNVRRLVKRGVDLYIVCRWVCYGNRLQRKAGWAVRQQCVEEECTTTVLHPAAVAGGRQTQSEWWPTTDNRRTDKTAYDLALADSVTLLSSVLM